MTATKNLRKLSNAVRSSNNSRLVHTFFWRRLDQPMVMVSPLDAWICNDKPLRFFTCPACNRAIPSSRAGRRAQFIADHPHTLTVLLARWFAVETGWRAFSLQTPPYKYLSQVQSRCRLLNSMNRRLGRYRIATLKSHIA